jgi:hypothetical protein
MEDILDQYTRPYDPRQSLLCDDERPCQLLGEVLVPLPMEPDRHSGRYRWLSGRNAAGDGV